jgi:tetratricopeptide (TPR) repeat protein
VLAHRERAWAAELPDVDPALLRWTAAAASLAGASTPQEAHALLALLPSLDGADPRPLRERLIGWWAGAVPGAGLLNPLLPERLGDHLVATTLTDPGGPQASAAVILDGLVRLPSAGQLAAALVVLARARTRYPDLAEPVDAMVLREVVPLARRASGDAASDPGHRGDPTSPRPGCAVGDGVLRLLTEPLRARLVAPGGGPPGHRDHQRDHHRDVASACRQLADVATGIGRVDDAADLLDIALRIDRALTGAMPRETEAALRGHVEALGRLVDQDPQNPTLRRQIAGALARLAQLDREEGRLALADAGYRRALDALAELLALDPENLEYRREVAAAHVRLAAMDAAAGWTAQAEAGYRRARELDDRSPRPSDRNSPHGG